MEKEVLIQLHTDFEKSLYVSEDTGTEFWLARNLQRLLGYAKWENFAKVIEKAPVLRSQTIFLTSGKRWASAPGRFVKLTIPIIM